MGLSLNSLRPVLDGALDLVFGSLCLLCSGPAPLGQAGLCPRCRAKMAPLAGGLCPGCGGVLEPEEGELCRGCRASPPPFDLARSYTAYLGAAREMVLAFKYARRPGLARAMAGLMAPWAAEKLAEAGGFDVLVPVPLHPKRLRERGYNQAALLARRIAGALKMPVDYTGLARVKPTAPQTGLEVDARFKNVKGAFRLLGKEPFGSKRVALVDDVLTSGATAAECAKTLKQGLARRVVVLTFARALGTGRDDET